jgi:hypothetical protein
MTRTQRLKRVFGIDQGFVACPPSAYGLAGGLCLGLLAALVERFHRSLQRLVVVVGRQRPSGIDPSRLKQAPNRVLAARNGKPDAPGRECRAGGGRCFPRSQCASGC